MSNSPNLADRTTLLEAIISSEGRRNVVAVQNNEARTVLMLLQEELDTSSDSVSRQTVVKVMIALAKRSGQFPPTFWLSNISEGKHVTGGGFGDVYEGSWSIENEQLPVALKISRGKPDPQKRKFCQEALLWRQLSHKNILPFLGLYQNGPKEAMVSPWMRNGNILQYLKNEPNADRYKLLIHASIGLTYLHEHDPPVLHSDLKPENILVHDNGNAMLADFGLARVQHDLPDLMSSTQNSGTTVYMSPELLSSRDGKSTEPSDIWALGMVVYQVFTGKPPYLGKFALNEICHSPLANLPSKPQGNAITIGFTDELWNFLGENCWAQKPRDRPTAQRCRRTLEVLQSKYLLSINPSSMNHS